MIWELVFGFAVLVAASYVGTTMALRGFFGRERYAPDFERSDEPPTADESNGIGESNGTED